MVFHQVVSKDSKINERIIILSTPTLLNCQIPLSLPTPQLCKLIENSEAGIELNQWLAMKN